MSSIESRRVVIEGIDGCGKSTAGFEAAEMLSRNYPASRIKLVDSSGVYRFANGELTSQAWQTMKNVIPKAASSRLTSITKLGAFTAARRVAEGIASGRADLTISIRDPFRIDPSVYAIAYGLPRLKSMDTAARLRFFNHFTLAPHPSDIVMLDVDAEQAQMKVNNRLAEHTDADIDFHETPGRQAAALAELPRTIDQYAWLYGSAISRITALRPSTSDEVAAKIEPALHYSLQAQDAKNLSATYL